MKNRLYVGGIPYKFSEDELKDYFAAIGTVTSVRIITDSMSGRSKGFGFVEMETEELATKAIEELDGSDCGGRSIRVAPAHPPKESGDRRPRDNFNR